MRLCPAFEPPPSALRRRFAASNPVGGVQMHTAHLTRALDAHGVGHTVLTRRTPTAPMLEQVGRHGRVVRVATFATMADLAPALARPADVVHAHFTIDLGLVPIAVAMARERGVPLVATVHCSLRHTLEAADARSRAIQRRGGAIEGWLERNADAIITLTPRLRDLLAGDGIPQARLHVIPSGVDPARFGRAPPDPLPDVPHPRLVFVGRLEPEKDAETLLRAAARSRHRVHVVLVGDGSRRDALTTLAGDLGLGPRVRQTGFLPHGDVPAVLAHADVVVQPSRMEELGTAIVEAMFAGVPVVVSDVGGVPVRDGVEGLRVPAADVAAFAAAIDRVLDEPALAARLGAAGRRRACREHDWRTLAPKVLTLYETLAELAATRTGVPAAR
jgi:glycosyltransferase involved in cell wall biosynthesis